MYKVVLGFYSKPEEKRYRVGDDYKGEDKEHVDDLLEQGLIEPHEGEEVVTDDDARKRKGGLKDKPE